MPMVGKQAAERRSRWGITAVELRHIQNCKLPQSDAWTRQSCHQQEHRWRGSIHWKFHPNLGCTPEQGLHRTSHYALWRETWGYHSTKLSGTTTYSVWLHHKTGNSTQGQGGLHTHLEMHINYYCCLFVSPVYAAFPVVAFSKLWLQDWSDTYLLWYKHAKDLLDHQHFWSRNRPACNLWEPNELRRAPEACSDAKSLCQWKFFGPPRP